MQETEATLERAIHCGEPTEAARLITGVLDVRRRLCQPLSLRRYHAERAACALAIGRDDHATARECGQHALAFLEATLAHVPWHPTLALERMQQAPPRTRSRLAHAQLVLRPASTAATPYPFHPPPPAPIPWYRLARWL